METTDKRETGQKGRNLDRETKDREERIDYIDRRCETE
jgi:hypothetical protein